MPFSRYLVTPMELYIWLLVWLVCIFPLLPCGYWRSFRIRHLEYVSQISPDEYLISVIQDRSRTYKHPEGIRGKRKNATLYYPRINSRKRRQKVVNVFKILFAITMGTKYMFDFVFMSIFCILSFLEWYLFCFQPLICCRYGRSKWCNLRVTQRIKNF